MRTERRKRAILTRESQKDKWEAMDQNVKMVVIMVCHKFVCCELVFCCCTVINEKTLAESPCIL